MKIDSARLRPWPTWPMLKSVPGTVSAEPGIKRCSRALASVRNLFQTFGRTLVCIFATPKLFSFLGPNPRNQKQITSSINLLQKSVDAYLENRRETVENVLSYWRDRECPTVLKDFVRETLSLTATSAQSERVFSIAGDFYRCKRSRLGKSLFRSLIFIKS